MNLTFNLVSLLTSAIWSKNDLDPGFFSFSNVAETLKIISLTLEDKKRFCLNILSFSVCERQTMWHEIARSKDIKKIVLSTRGVQYVMKTHL